MEYSCIAATQYPQHAYSAEALRRIALYRTQYGKRSFPPGRAKHRRHLEVRQRNFSWTPEGNSKIVSMHCTLPISRSLLGFWSHCCCFKLGRYPLLVAALQAYGGQPQPLYLPSSRVARRRVGCGEPRGGVAWQEGEQCESRPQGDGEALPRHGSLRRPYL